MKTKIIFLLTIIGFFTYNCQINNIKNFEYLGVMSILFGFGIFCIIKSFQYLVLSKKVKAKIIKQGRSIQEIGSYSHGYRYEFLIKDQIYTMPKYFHFGTKYYEGDVIKVSIINEKKKIAIPIRATYNIIIIGFVSLLIPIKIIERLL